MDFRADEEHRAYAGTLRALLSGGAPPEAARAWAAGDRGPGRRLWRSLAATGLVALAVPEGAAQAGLGLRPAELASAFVQLGRAGMPGPVVETVALAAALAAELGAATPPTPSAPGQGKQPEQAGESRPGPAPRPAPWLAAALAGDALLTVADPAGPYALDVSAADAVFVLADAEPPAGPRPVLRPAKPVGDPLTSLDPVRTLTPCAPVPGGPVPADTALLRSLALLLTAAQALGTGRALLAGSVAHAARRTQFGRPIGSFQAVKHQLATVAVALEFAEPLLYGAAVALAEERHGSPDLPAAKAACADAAYGAARTALQVHGALGYTDEYDLTLLLRKARALRTAWGTPSACRAAVLERCR